MLLKYTALALGEIFKILGVRESYPAVSWGGILLRQTFLTHHISCVFPIIN